MSCFTCPWSFILLLFTFSRTGHTYLCVKTIANAVWLVNSHLVIFVPFSCGLSSFIFMMFVFISSWSLRLVILVCQVVSRTLRGCVTLCCRLLVIIQSLHLVVLVFEECLALSGGVLLFVVGCLLLGKCYDWSYWFSKNVSNLAGVCYSLL